jgi:hypothetical protein
MDKGRDKPSKDPRDSKDPHGAKGPRDQEALKPGSVAVDARGRNVWHFHGESIDSTSMMLQKLDNPSLALEPTRKTKQLESGKDAAAGKAPAGNAPAGKASAGKPAAPAAGKSSGDNQGDQGRKRDFGGTSQSFEQRYEVKPGGKSRGGGFDPYNRS